MDNKDEKKNMDDLKLVYKASSIAAAERKYQMKFFDAIANLGGIAEIVFFFVAGGATEDDADVFMQKKGITEAMVVIMEAISESGFLGEVKIDMEGLRQEMKEATKQAASQITGEASKN